jgi:hypothetical protein
MYTVRPPTPTSSSYPRFYVLLSKLNILYVEPSIASPLECYCPHWAAKSYSLLLNVTQGQTATYLHLLGDLSETSALELVGCLVDLSWRLRLGGGSRTRTTAALGLGLEVLCILGQLHQRSPHVVFATRSVKVFTVCQDITHQDDSGDMDVNAFARADDVLARWKSKRLMG